MLRGSRQEFLGWTPVSVKLRVPPRQSRGNSHFISRDFELEADQLGIQYVWKTGYDPNGFIRFFDKLASKHGYAIGASWFRTHPPFYERMVQSKREMMYLPKKESWIVQTTVFEEMKPVLKKVAAKSNAEQDAKRPTLLSKEERCEAPAKQLYKPEDSIETICSSLTTSSVARDH